MSTANRQIFDPDDPSGASSALHPPLQAVRRAPAVVRDQVVGNQVDWEPFENPWRAPQALLDLIGSAAGVRPGPSHNGRIGSSQK